MSMPEFVKIARCHNAAEADHAKAVLEMNGIAAFVDGADLKTSLSYIGSAIGDVNLVVRSADAERALQVLEEFRQHDPDGKPGPWFCGTCEVEVDEGFELCWSCGQPRGEVEAEPPAVAEFAPKPVGTDTTDPANAELPVNASTQETNPYAPPIASEPSEPIDDEEDDEVLGDQERAEELVVQASNAAVFGAFIPILGTLFSLYLLGAAFLLSRTYPSKSKRLIAVSLVINFFVPLVWMVLLWVSLSDPY